jgi:hypothetical protein
MVQGSEETARTSTGGKIATLLVGDLLRTVGYPLLHHPMVACKQQERKGIKRAILDKRQLKRKGGESPETVWGHGLCKQLGFIYSLPVEVDCFD